jgi:septal ring factor EnvC (AmiA/AmiB activator)
MKFIKNRIIQILAVGILLIVTIAGLYYFSKPTFADDKISMKNFNEKMEVVNLRIEELEEKIVNLEQEFVTKIENLEQEFVTKIENLEQENEKLKTELSNTDKKISDLTNRVNKIEARENYLYEKGQYQRYGSLIPIFRYINENLK